MVLDSRVCNSTNTLAVAQDAFWDFSDDSWSPHKIGWTVSGACGVATTIVTFTTLTLHALNYQIPAQQRQIGRVVLMPWVYGVLAFFSYRYFRYFIYFELIEVAYEGITLAAFLLLLVEFVSTAASNGDVKNTLQRKDKEGLPMTFGLIRFRASKPYFIHALKWSVLQYAIFRPLISIVGIICEAFDVLCPEQYSVHFAEVYLEAFDFVVISIALYGLVCWYDLTKHELKGRQPLNKFLSIKLIVFFTFYQSFVISALAKHGYITANEYWTVTNISDGLNALCISVEMVIFSVWMAFAFPAKEYNGLGIRSCSFLNYLRFIRDVIWFGDFAMEIWTANLFFFDYLCGKPGTRSKEMNGFDHRLNKAFGVDEDSEIPMSTSGGGSKSASEANGGGSYAPIQRSESTGGDLSGKKGRDVHGTWR
ncbi:organic solute transporter Ostalpha-domain-containing protein [Mrakia frigida]|uniref:OSTA/TMEM184 family protein n=1 Tax=Mrakia frigida TaxID=29902 RepID=UPI003FCC1FDB